MEWIAMRQNGIGWDTNVEDGNFSALYFQNINPVTMIKIKKQTFRLQILDPLRQKDLAPVDN